MPMASWGRGNMPASYNVGNVPSYLAAFQACPLINCGAGYGAINAGANSHLNFDSANDLVDTTKKFAWTDINKRTFEAKVNFIDDGTYQALMGSWYSSGVATQYSLLIYPTEEPSMFFKRGGTLIFAKASTKLTDGDHTLHFMKDGSTLKMWIDGVEVSYDTQQAYNLGTDTCDNNTYIGNDRRLLYAWNGKIYCVNVYEDAISQARITENAALDKDMGEIANNVGNEIIFGASAKKIIPAGIFEGSH